ncbi:MAG: DUF7706 family protein [Enterobacteriaceae bacterium]
MNRIEISGLMRDAINQLQKALAEQGYAPR